MFYWRARNLLILRFKRLYDSSLEPNDRDGNSLVSRRMTCPVHGPQNPSQLLAHWTIGLESKLEKLLRDETRFSMCRDIQKVCFQSRQGFLIKLDSYVPLHVTG